MELTELVNSVRVIHLIGDVQRKDISGIFYDSRKVIKNSIFVAIKGFNADGHKFILDAINNGAIAVILEYNNSVPDEIFIHGRIVKMLVSDSRKALAEISNAYYKEPSKKLKLFGITGTNGKTTTAFILKSILENSGEKVGLMGTIANYIGEIEIMSKLTTPESNDLNDLLLKMYNEGCKSSVMEVSSHSLKLNRVYALNFYSGIFTNITSDHLDFHKTFENYLEAKKILFDSLPLNSIGIYNIDDKSSAYLIKDSKAKLYSYGQTDSSDFRISKINYDLKGTSFKINFDGKIFPISTSLVGEFNAYNACAAFAAGVLSGIDGEKVVDGIKNTKQVPGRFEVVGNDQKKVIIDYSHTADSLEKTLLAIKNIVKNERPVYTVFGCGGNRDKTKRPVMGKIASELSKKVFVTSDNPRTEEPMSIINEILTGIKNKNYEVNESREEAIKTAVQSTEEGAVILVAGKGHENYQEINGVRVHFSDKETVQKYLFK